MKKKILLIFTLCSLLSCQNTNHVYWCGDHECINNKEKDEYFKKTMIVEIRNTKKNEKNRISDFEKISSEASNNNFKKIINKNEKTKNAFEDDLVKKMESEKKISMNEITIDDTEIQEELEAETMAINQEKLSKNESITSNNIEILEKKVNEITAEKNSECEKLDSCVQSNYDTKSSKVNSTSNVSKFEETLSKINKKNETKDFPDINNTDN